MNSIVKAEDKTENVLKEKKIVDQNGRTVVVSRKIKNVVTSGLPFPSVSNKFHSYYA